MPATSARARSPEGRSQRSSQQPPLRRVVVIGPAHFLAFRGLALPTVAAFRTPLGDVALDAGALAALQALPQVMADDGPHAREHALEVELPFLQSLLGAFALVPLLVGEARACCARSGAGRRRCS